VQDHTEIRIQPREADLKGDDDLGVDGGVHREPHSGVGNLEVVLAARVERLLPSFQGLGISAGIIAF